MDEHAREQERQAASGDVDAAAAVLRERVRRGELPRERVELAARLGDEAAALLHPELEPLTWDRAGIMAAASRARDLLDDPTLTTRLATDWLERVLYQDPGIGTDTARGLRNGIAAARAWVDCPCEAHYRNRTAARWGLIDPPPGPLAELSLDARAHSNDTPAECSWQQQRLAAYLLGEA